MGVVLATAGLGLAAQTQQMPAQAPAQAHQTSMPPAAKPAEPVDNPVADPKAIVTIGNARFTILTPQLIRMEWSADGKFEDHASLVFINRRLPVPKYTTSTVKLGGVHVLEIKTDALSLHYVLTDSEAADKTAFGPENLNIAVPMGDGNATWRPGQIDHANLQGTTRTSRRRARRQNARAHRAGPGFARGMGACGRFHAAAVRFHRFPFSSMAKRARGRGRWSGRRMKHQGNIKIGTSSATGMTTSKRLATT
jgi:hypothetical protein